MKNKERWDALAEVDAAVQAAADKWAREPTPQTRTAMESAYRDYVERLPSVIGQVEASRFEASLRLYLARIIHEGTESSRETNAPVWYKGCADNTLATTEAHA